MKVVAGGDTPPARLVEGADRVDVKALGVADSGTGGPAERTASRSEEPASSRGAVG